ncbi:MAG: DUF359 domain-containing protein [Promethearchaeota archaeon]
MNTIDTNADYVVTSEIYKKIEKPIDFFLPNSAKIQNTLKNLNKILKSLRKKYNFKNDFQINCVGDVITENLIKHKKLRRKLKICCIDLKTHGKKRQFNNFNYFENKIEVKNIGRNRISSNSLKGIQNATKLDGKTLILVDGEEDLLVAAMILFSKEGNFVLYGWRDVNIQKTSENNNLARKKEGIIIVPITLERKNQIFNLFNELKKE